MDDSCAVCAESLEWVAYGACGHKDVCSTCVSRLRFICDDRRCCICKTPSDVVFVTKALGDYTRMINDFTVLPAEVREGKVGSYWYHEDTQAFFDDLEHYKMIKAMCKLSCTLCDGMEEKPSDSLKRRIRFRNVGQLKGHLFHQHKLLMCSLCLEGRKVFICEQKLYTRSQLKQHISTGDSEVDGSESERGGFMGHPTCEFCKTPFYGDNELYTHMSTEHYTCHICQRQHPGQYEYFKNYDDLENHFGREHFLCEDDACLAKKFVVFQTEAEMKKHNTIEHGGRMSRAKRNAALQIPTSFLYRRGNEQAHHRRGRIFHRDRSDDQLSMAIEASLEMAIPNGPLHDTTSSSTQEVTDHGGRDYLDPIIQPFESLTTTDSESTSRYRQALGQSSTNVTLGQSAFPPLSTAPGNNQHKPNQDSEALSNNTMAAHLRRQNRKDIPSPAPAWTASNRGPALPSSNLNQSRFVRDAGPLSLHGSGSGAASSFPSPTPTLDQFPKVHGVSAGSPWKAGKSSKIIHSASAPNLTGSGSSESSVYAIPSGKLQNRQGVVNVEHVQTANKSLVEKIRSALDFDEDKYNAFKEISGQYRQDTIDTGTYLYYVGQFGLSHIVLDLASLCPDARKQKELVDTYNANLKSNVFKEAVRDSKHTTLGEGKRLDSEKNKTKDKLADSFISTVRKLQSSYNPSEEQTEILLKDGYRNIKGKSSELVDEHQMELDSAAEPFPKLRGDNNSSSTVTVRAADQSLGDGGGRSQSLVDGGGRSKQRKKTSKFHRVRLGDGSMSNDPDPIDQTWDGNQNPAPGIPVRGVWRRGGGHKLFP